MNSVFERPAHILSALLSSLFLVMATGGAATAVSDSPGSMPWIWQPWVTMAGGHESDLVLDPEFTRTVVPGGNFLELAPGFRLTKPLSDVAAFRLLNRNTLERFFNDEGRTLFASSLFGDFRFGGRSPFRSRVTLMGDYFNDSGSASFRRLSGGLEAAAGARFANWSFEVSGYLQGRRYPNISVATSASTSQAYTEDHRGMSSFLAWHPFGDLFVKGQLTGRRTEALDPAFDSRSATVFGSIDYRLPGGFWVSANYTGQSRVFDNRVAGQDRDSYDQVGFGVSRVISGRIDVTARYAYANYTYPLGGEQNTNRISLAATWQFGRKSPTIVREPLERRAGGSQPHYRGESVSFGIQAPQASKVSLVGSFNNWNPDANPLRRNHQGRWETRLVLPVGTHEYLYLVDGETRLPNDTVRTVDDGFGGRNGIIVILGDKQ